MPFAAPAIMGCIAPARRRRIEQALESVAVVEWHESFAAMADALVRASTRPVVLVDGTDSRGVEAGPFVASVAAQAPDTPLVLFATQREIMGGAISTPAFTDVIVADETDSKLLVRATLLRAVLRLAAERVVTALRERLTGQLATLAEVAVRNPSCTTVERLADRMGVHRQTIALWCRRENSLRPEEFLMWCRLLLVSAVLSRSERSVTAISMDLDFPSPVALRNQLKRYTGLTAMEIREAGLDAILGRFERAVEQAGRRPRSVLGTDISEAQHSASA